MYLPLDVGFSLMGFICIKKRVTDTTSGVYITHIFNPLDIPKGFTVCHLNLRSLRKKISELAIILDSYSLDILTLSETWLDTTVEDTLLAIQGYNLYRQDRSLQTDLGHLKRSGGLAIYAKHKFVINPDKYAHLNVCTINCEIQVVTVKPSNDRETIIINIYRPPAGDTGNFVEEITGIMDIVAQERYADIYILGDININHLEAANNNVAKNVINMLKAYGLTQGIEKPTRRTNQSKLLIDVIYVCSIKKITSFILPIAMSDHYLVGTSRFLNYVCEPKREIFGRS